MNKISTVVKIAELAETLFAKRAKDAIAIVPEFVTHVGAPPPDHDHQLEVLTP